MKIKTQIKLCLGLGAAILISLGFSTSTYAALDCSGSYCLDFGGVTFGSQNYISSSFEVQSGPAPIETNSDSNSYKIATINLLPICGDGILDPGEECDSGNLNGKLCTDYGFDLGAISCDSSCRIDTSLCEYSQVPLPPKPDKKPPEEEIPPGEEIPPEEIPPEEIPPEEELPTEIEIVKKIIPLEIEWKIPQKVTPAPKKPIVTKIEEKPEIKKIAWTNTIDETLFLTDELEPEKTYSLNLTNSTGIIIHSAEIKTDKNGLFVYEYETQIQDGYYVFYLYDKDEKFVKKYSLKLKERKVKDLKIDSFANQSEVKEDFIGTVKLNPLRLDKNQEIKGQGTPGAEIIAYYINNEIRTVKTTVNECGKFNMPIPSDLENGDYTLYIIEVYPDGLWSKDLTYTFSVNERCSYCCVLIFTLIFIFFLLHHYFELPDTKEKKKFAKKIKKYFSKLFILGLVLMILPIKPGLTSVPQFLIYEGRLLNSSGQVLNSAHTFRFSFWTTGDKVATDIDGVTGAINAGAATYAGWQEVQTITPNNNGTFSIDLGTVTALPTIDYNYHKFLQVEIKTAGDPDTAYELMDPTGDNGSDTDDRKILGSVPYSFVSESAQHSNDETFTLDFDNTIENAGTGSIELKFGDTLNKILSYDTDNSYFNFNDNVNIEGNITLTGTVDGVDISNLQFTDIATRVKEMAFEAEYDGSSVYTDGSDNRGKLETEAIDLGGTDKLNYYKWTTRQNSLQDINIVISYQLPRDFDSFTATPLSFIYRTSDGTLTKNKIDILIYDTTGTAVTLTGANDLANGSWTTANITFGGSPTFTAGDTVTVHIKLSTTKDGFSEAADLVLNYNGR